MAGEGETPTDSGAQLVALAPKGAKPGAFMAATTQVTARITDIDAEHRKATLQFEDGTTKTVPVRRDVDLSSGRSVKKCSSAPPKGCHQGREAVADVKVAPHHMRAGGTQ